MSGRPRVRFQLPRGGLKFSRLRMKLSDRILSGLLLVGAAVTIA
jgi:hypothetical protein